MRVDQSFLLCWSLFIPFIRNHERLASIHWLISLIESSWQRLHAYVSQEYFFLCWIKILEDRTFSHQWYIYFLAWIKMALLLKHFISESSFRGSLEENVSSIFIYVFAHVHFSLCIWCVLVYVHVIKLLSIREICSLQFVLKLGSRLVRVNVKEISFMFFVLYHWESRFKGVTFKGRWRRLLLSSLKLLILAYLCFFCCHHLF